MSVAAEDIDSSEVACGRPGSWQCCLVPKRVRRHTRTMQHTISYQWNLLQILPPLLIDCLARTRPECNSSNVATVAYRGDPDKIGGLCEPCASGMLAPILVLINLACSAPYFQASADFQIQQSPCTGRVLLNQHTFAIITTTSHHG
jgi:hypothetical protein